MFDVSWTDPGSETVGQRRQRKEQGIEKPYESARRDSVRTTSSSGSSQTNTSSRPKLGGGWGLFGSSKKSSGSQKETRSSASTVSSNPKEGLKSSLSISTSRSNERERDVISRANESRPYERPYERPQTIAELQLQEQEYHESIESPPTPGKLSCALGGSFAYFNSGFCIFYSDVSINSDSRIIMGRFSLRYGKLKTWSISSRPFS